MVEVRPIKPLIGAEIFGVDLTNLSDADFEVIYQAWLDHHVLVIHGQKLGIEDFLNYSERFGPVEPHITKRTRHPVYPKLTVMGENKVQADGKVDEMVAKRGEGWHTDTPYLQEPAKATQLYALAIPSYGGDTLFASQYAAYDALPAALKARIANLNATYRYSGREGKNLGMLEPADRERPLTVHPVVRVHPETGRPALYVNPGHIMDIVGMERAEADVLLEELYKYSVLPEAEYRHKWQVGDVVIWDNRCLLHSAAGGYPLNEDRIHWRVTIMEDKSRWLKGLNAAAE
ncbi:MAG: TauD/TfdA family dioxygenase [Acetobacteraceae bacterium]